MNQPLVLLAAATLLAFTASGFAEPLDPLLTGDNLWVQKQDEFMSAAKKLGFEWTSGTRDSARAARKEMTAFGLPAVECLARFGGDTLREITIVFYARGDAGDWPEKKFDALITDAGVALNKATNVKPVLRGRDPTSAVKADGVIWTTDKARYLLEFSKTKEVKSRSIPFRAEFVRLEILPPEKKTGLLANATTSGPTKFSGSAHVKKDASSGDVWIGDVPMVDQGQKGYCVVASAERVMRYYGNSVDQQELAQVANSSASEGTSFNAMFDALKKLSARLKVRVREVEKSDIKDILKMMTDYNRAAKKASAPLIPDQGNTIRLDEVYGAMDAAVFKEVRTKSKGDLDRFQRSVQTHINEGTPLLWTVMLGKVPEKGIPQAAGGHMRLIIGYNSKTAEILYSDSWGAGHELKRMPAADAWTITTGAMSIEPF
jgi:hypothetical protein